MDGTVSVSNLWKSFGGSGFFTRWGRKVPALQGVGFGLGSGELAALVGESGSGKTTLGRCLLGLVRFEQGTVRVNGCDVAALKRSDETRFRMGAQMVFQNPYSSLNPAFRVRQALAEAVRVHGRPATEARRRKRWKASPRSCSSRWRGSANIRRAFPEGRAAGCFRPGAGDTAAIRGDRRAGQRPGSTHPGTTPGSFAQDP